MHRRPSHIFIIILSCLTALAVTSLTSSALAAPGDKAATKLYDEAMDEDYLNTDFDDAIKKLKKADGICKKKKCSKAVHSKVLVGLGTVYGGGKNDKKNAKGAFVAAFAIDANAKPLSDYMTPDLKKIFDEAKAEAAEGDDDDDDDDDGDDDDDDDDDGDDDDDDDEPAGDLDFTPPEEALVDYPLPIFVTTPEDLDVGSVTLRYKPFGAPKWLKVKMRRVKKGWQGVVPCVEITTTGDLKIFILVKDKEGDAMAQAGTRNAPLVVNIKNSIEGKQPSLPGKKPPDKCMTKSDCPPGMKVPGCPEPGAAGGNRGWGASCEESEQCRSGLACINNVCEQGGEDDDDDDDDDGGGKGVSDDIALNIFYLGGQVDLLVINGAENVCGIANGPTAGYEQQLENYFCFNPDGEFLGKPQEGDFNQIQGGMGLAGGRIMIGYDRIIWPPLLKGLAAGIRVGVAFGGSPSTGDSEDRFKKCQDNAGVMDPGGTGDTLARNECHANLANDFLPVHIEARVSYWFPDPSGFMDGLIRPYGFLGGGLAQVNAGVQVAVCDYVNSEGLPVADSRGRCSPDGPNGQRHAVQRDDIEAFQVTGLNFVDFGLGGNIAFHPMFGLNVEAKLMLMVPTFGFVIAPNISPVFMF